MSTVFIQILQSDEFLVNQTSDCQMKHLMERKIIERMNKIK